MLLNFITMNMENYSKLLSLSKNQINYLLSLLNKEHNYIKSVILECDIMEDELDFLQKQLYIIDQITDILNL